MIAGHTLHRNNMGCNSSPPRGVIRVVFCHDNRYCAVPRLQTVHERDASTQIVE